METFDAEWKQMIILQMWSKIIRGIPKRLSDYLALLMVRISLHSSTFWIKKSKQGKTHVNFFIVPFTFNYIIKMNLMYFID